MATMPIYEKNFRKSSSPEPRIPWDESLHKSSGTRCLPKLLKWGSYIDAWSFYREFKFASLCICMGPIHLYGKMLRTSNDLLWSYKANSAQISCGASLGQWKKNAKMVAVHWPKMATMLIYGKTYKNLLLQNQLIPGAQSLQNIFQDRRSTKVAKLMVLPWYLTFLPQGQICFPYAFVWAFYIYMGKMLRK